MKIYNPLSGEAREWAKAHKMPTAEWAIMGKETKKSTANPKVSVVAGDGKFGFNSRRFGQDKVKMTEGQDGQYVRKRRGGKRKKLGCRLACRRELVGEDPAVKEVRIREEEKARKEAAKQARKAKRNRKADRGRRAARHKREV